MATAGCAYCGARLTQCATAKSGEALPSSFTGALVQQAATAANVLPPPCAAIGGPTLAVTSQLPLHCRGWRAGSTQLRKALESSSSRGGTATLGRHLCRDEGREACGREGPILHLKVHLRTE